MITIPLYVSRAEVSRPTWLTGDDARSNAEFGMRIAEWRSDERREGAGRGETENRGNGEWGVKREDVKVSRGVGERARDEGRDAATATGMATAGRLG